MQPQRSPISVGDGDDNYHESSNSSPSLPELIRVEAAIQSSRHAAGCTYNDSISDSNPSIKLNTSSSSAGSGHGGLSQASTACADDIYQPTASNRRETSDDGLFQQLKKKTSSSSSISKSRSDSSSLYPASNPSTSVSSMSSDASLGPSQEFQPHALEPVKEDIVEKDEELCSQDLFVEKEYSNAAILSQEDSKISTPQDRSTPVDDPQKQAKSLYKKALTRTSTPLDGQEQLHTSPSQEGFNCLQFSGTSSSSYPKIASPSDSYVQEGACRISPSSPTEQSIKDTVASTSGSSSTSVEMINPSPSSFDCRAMTVSSSPEEKEITTQNSEMKNSANVVSTVWSMSSASSGIINPSPSSFQCRAMAVSSTPEEKEMSQHSSHKMHSSNQDNDDEFDGLPQWQQQVLSEHNLKQQQHNVKPTSNPSTSTSNNSNEIIEEHHPWQSIPLESTRGELSTVGSLKDKPAKHVTFLMDESLTISSLVSKPDQAVTSKDNNNDSLSPSSFVIDEQGLAKIPVEKTHPKRVCSQLELSNDLFSDDSMQNNNKSSDNVMQTNQEDIPVSQPSTPPASGTNKEEIGDSPEFELYMNSTQPQDVIHSTLDAVLPPVHSNIHTASPSGRETLLAEPMQREAMTSNTNETTHDTTTMTEHVATGNTTKPSSPPKTNSVTHSEANIGKGFLPLGSLLKRSDSSSPVFYKSMSQHTITDKECSEQLSRQNTEPVESTQDVSSHQKHDTTSSHRSAMPPLLSESSSESGSGFHFSLPVNTAPLRPVTCTSPPPMQTWQPVVAPTTVRETPDPNVESLSQQDHPNLSTLTFSMARKDSPVSDSENMQVSFHLKEPAPSKLSKRKMTTRARELSVFERARKDAKRSKLLVQKNEEKNPFLFSSQDEAVFPPICKRPKAHKSGTAAVAEPPLSESCENQEPIMYVKTTMTRTFKTTTTTIKRVISVETTKKGSDQVIETFSYVEEDDPITDTNETEKIEKETFIDTGNFTYVRQPRPVVQPSLEGLRISPRRKRRKQSSTSSDEFPRQTKKAKLESSLKSPAKAKKDTSKSSSPSSLCRQTTDTVEENRAAADLHLTPGTRVFARWSDNFFYPGTLTGSSGIKPGHTYTVLFDDGDKRKVHSDHLIARNSLNVGQHVLAQGQDGFYDPGTIVGHFGSSTEGRGYEIEISSNKKSKKYLERFVILSEEQARVLVNTSSTSSSGLSRTGSDMSTKSKSCTPSTGGLSKSGDTSAKDTSCSSNEIPRRDHPLASSSKGSTTTSAKDNVETPKSSCRKSRKLRRYMARLRRGVVESSSEGSSEDRVKKRVKRSLLKKPSTPTRTSPRKAGQNTNTTDLNPVPSNDTLFAGLAFLITGSYTNLVQTDSEGDHDQMQLDRAHLKLQIETGGGVVLEKFQQTQNTVADQCFLVSNTYQRTVKYFQCLAYGIPIVHHLWIHDCSVSNTLKDFKKYLLPAGKSLVTDEIVEFRSRPTGRILQRLNIYLQGSNNFKTTWSSVVVAAGGHVITKCPNRPGRVAQLHDNELCNVVISSTKTLPQSLQYTCEVLGIPVVGLEWLFQCLINGFVVEHDGHPRFYPNNMSKEDIEK